jgi:NADH:ubiquinone oxidoreductase subunit 6 (subunit J)
MNLHKVTKIAAIIVAVLSLIFLGGLFATSDSEDNSWINPLIYLSYVILLACVAVVLIYVFKNLFSNKENLKKTLITIGLFLVAVLISYIFSDGTEVKSVTNEVIATESTSKWVGTGILLTTILAIIAIASVVWTGFNKIKK